MSKKIKLISDFFTRNRTREEDLQNIELEELVDQPESAATHRNASIEETTSNVDQEIRNDYIQDARGSIIEESMSIESQVSQVASNDIGKVFVNGIRNQSLIGNLSDFEKKEFLTNHWLPDDSFQFPYSNKGKQRVYLNMRHITGSNGCFKYSPSMCGLLCVPCVLFASSKSNNDRNKGTMLGQLVIKPLSKYAHLTGSDGHLSSHLKTEYHKSSQTFADSFIQSLESGTNVLMLVDSQHSKLVKENRERLIPIVKTTILCGRLGIAYRRKANPKEDQIDNEDDAPLVEKDGNFNALLEFRVDAGDKVLADHLKTAGKNATYISKTIQNELISICGDILAESIIKDIKCVKYFSVLADETTDASHKEQLCICFRYVVEKDHKHLIREEFVQFENATDLTGAGLSSQILSIIRKFGLNPDYLVGQGYDGAAAMSGRLNGVQALIKEEARHAVYVHCSSHTLNLVLNSSSSVPEIRDMFSTVQECINFINDSVKRRDAMAQQLQESGSTLTKLKTFCETRFVERHDALIVFQQHYSSIVDVLEEISSFADKKAADGARSLLRSLTDSVFLVGLCCAKKVMSLTHSLSKSLQTVNKDLINAMQSVEFVSNTLQSWREEDEEWKDEDYGPYFVAKKLAHSVGITLDLPRLIGRQRHRSNVPAESTEEYFRRAIWYPYLDTIIQSINQRFTNHSDLVHKMAALLPSHIEVYTWNDIKNSVLLYKPVLGNPDEEQVRFQFLDWKAFCSNLSVKPTSPLEALDKVPDRLDCIKKLLTIFCTMPVTTCTAERAFSALRILKTYLRNRMTDERLTGLALMFIHPDIDISVEEVIDRFANSKKRKLNFVV